MIFRHSAAQALLDTIEWGRRTRRNVAEQGGLLIGNVCDRGSGDPEHRRLWVEVLHIIPCENPESSTAESLNMSPDNWVEMLHQFDTYNREHQTSYVLLGWYHTHPNQLGVSYSGIDLENHAAWFTAPYHIAAIFNPHRLIWSVFSGHDMEPADGCLFLSPEQRSEGTDAAIQGRSVTHGDSPSHQPPPEPAPPAPAASTWSGFSAPTGARPSVQLSCSWHVLYPEQRGMSFPFGGLFPFGQHTEIHSEPDYEIASLPINDSIAEVCQALLGLLSLDPVNSAVMAAVSLVTSRDRLRVYGSVFYESVETMLRSEPLLVSPRQNGLLLIGPLARLMSRQGDIYQFLTSNQMAWVAILDTDAVKAYRRGQIQVYGIK